MPIHYDKTHFYFSGHLTLHPDQGIRFTHGAPAKISGGDRIMALKIKVPRSVFQTPTLSATIDISDEHIEAIHIDTEACADVLRQVVGADVAVTLLPPEQEDAPS